MGWKNQSPKSFCQPDYISDSRSGRPLVAADVVFGSVPPDDPGDQFTRGIGELYALPLSGEPPMAIFRFRPA